MRRYTVRVTVEADSPFEALCAAGDLLMSAESIEDLAALEDPIVIRKVTP